MSRATRKSTRPAGARQPVAPINTLRIADRLNDINGRLAVVGLAVEGAAAETDHDNLLGPVLTAITDISDAITEVVADIHPPRDGTTIAGEHAAEAPDNDADKLSRVSDLQQAVTELFQMADLARDLDLEKTDQTAHGERVSAVVVQVARMAGELKRGYYDALWPGQNHDAA